MITAILDTNVLVQSLLASAPSASARVLDAYYNLKYRLIHSPQTLDELLEVLLVPRIRARHGLSDGEIAEFLASLLFNGTSCTAESHAPPSMTRDATDTKFLDLAEVSNAGYLVTNNHRHLLPIRRYQDTRIVTPAQFLVELGDT
jgi:putative PIN family toxin of toxin-antitoxin system